VCDEERFFGWGFVAEGQRLFDLEGSCQQLYFIVSIPVLGSFSAVRLWEHLRETIQRKRKKKRSKEKRNRDQTSKNLTL
jgi:hypothetical protein